MSKLKVSFGTIFKACFLIQHTKKYRYIHIFTFLETLRQYNPFVEKPKDDKVLTYWIHHSIPDIITIADRLFEEEKYLELYELLNRIKFIEEPEILWRIAQALYYMSLENGITDEVKWTMINEASQVLHVALPIGDHSADVHKWAAIILDCKYGLVNLESRVKNSEIVKEHLEKACILNPTDFASHYMLGKWYFEMSNLTWVQKCITKFLVARSPPKSTYEQAYRYLSRAEELQPRSFLPNIYLLGQTCMEIGQYYKAKYYLNMVTTLPPKDDCERYYVNKAKRCIQKLERYDLGKNVLFYGDDPFGLHH